MKNLGILLSGRGSNLEAIAKNVASGKIPDARIAVVISNKPDAGGLEISSFETVGVDDDVGGLSHKAELIIVLKVSAKCGHRKDQSYA